MRATWRSNLTLSIASLVITLLVGEIVLWCFMPFPHPYAVPDTPDQRVYDEIRRVPRNRYVPSYHIEKVLHLQPDLTVLPGVSPKVTFSINRFGFRNVRMESSRKPTGEIRVFAIGGSTTECLYLNDTEAWPEVLHRKLSIEVRSVNVINAGHSGDNTRDHIALLSQRIVSFQPDVVLFLVGLNDIALQIQPDYSAIRNDARSLIPEEQFDFGLWLKSQIADFSQIARLAIFAKRNTLKEDERGNPVQDTHGIWVQRKREHLQQAPLREVDPDGVLKPEFEENLRTLVGITRYSGAEPVLMTQPVIWGAPSGDWENRLVVSFGGGRIAHTQLWRILETFNNVTRRIATELDVPLVDLASTLPKTMEEFYDDVHFTVAGAQRVAEEVARVFHESARLRDQIGIRASH